MASCALEEGGAPATQVLELVLDRNSYVVLRRWAGRPGHYVCL